MTGWLIAQTDVDLVTWIRDAGSLGLLALAVVAFMRRWVVPGPTHDEVIAERDRALNALEKYSEIAQRALESAERK
jgi:hypothetical protein